MDCKESDTTERTELRVDRVGKIPIFCFIEVTVLQKIHIQYSLLKLGCFKSKLKAQGEGATRDGVVR